MDTPSGRVQVVSRSALRSPGACALCGAGTCIEGFLDPDIYFEWEGNIYFCMNCARQFAHVIGCLLPEESQHLKELNDQIAKELKETKEKLNEFRELDDNLRRVYSDLVVDTISKPAGVAGKESDTESKPPVGTSSGASERESVAKKSVKSRRPNDASQPESRNKSELNL